METDSGPNAGTGSGEDNDQGVNPSTTTQQPNDPQLGVLSAENRKRRKENDALRAELDQLKAAHATEAEQAIAKARAEGENAYKTRWRKASVENLALARLAAKGIADTGLALKALDLASIDVDDEGRADAGAVDAAIDAALKLHPSLAGSSANGDDSTPPLDGSQRRVTREELLKADADKRNELLRFALGH